MKFSEAVKSYSQWKLENKGTSKVSSKELAALRKQYREGNIVDTTKRPAMREGAALLRRYSAWKLREHGTSKVTEAEKRMLLKESTSLKAPKVSLSGEIKKYSEWKEMNHGTSKVTMREVEVLKKHLLRESECENCEPQKDENEEGEEKLTENKIRESMREARKAIYRAKKALREGDMAMAQDATMDAADAMPPADGVADAAAQGAVPQNIVDAVSAIQASVNDLATQCGIEPPVDPSADPNAGVPAVDGVADPNMAAGAPAPAGADPMMEAKDLKDVKNRLKEREERINSVKAMNTVQNPLADIGDTVNPEMYAARKVNKTDSPDTVPTPSTQSLISGTEKGATKWPTEKLNVRESAADAYLERRIQESKDAEDFSWAKILQSGILG